MIELNGDLDFIRINKDAFCACPDESIDYAVMEKTNDAVVIPMDAGWSDVGSWSSLWEMSNKTIEENVIVGDVITYDSDSSYLRSDSGLLATVGVKDLVVVQTKDAVLVANRNSVQNVKKLSKGLNQKIVVKFLRILKFIVLGVNMSLSIMVNAMKLNEFP